MADKSSSKVKIFVLLGGVLLALVAIPAVLTGRAGGGEADGGCGAEIVMEEPAGDAGALLGLEQGKQKVTAKKGGDTRAQIAAIIAREVDPLGQVIPRAKLDAYLKTIEGRINKAGKATALEMEPAFEAIRRLDGDQGARMSLMNSFSHKVLVRTRRDQQNIVRLDPEASALRIKNAANEAERQQGIKQYLEAVDQLEPEEQAKALAKLHTMLPGRPAPAKVDLDGLIKTIAAAPEGAGRQQKIKTYLEASDRLAPEEQAKTLAKLHALLPGQPAPAKLDLDGLLKTITTSPEGAGKQQKIKAYLEAADRLAPEEQARQLAALNLVAGAKDEEGPAPDVAALLGDIRRMPEGPERQAKIKRYIQACDRIVPVAQGRCMAELDRALGAKKE